MERYNHQKIESKWQGCWEADGVYKVADTVSGKENFYHLIEFPYPSGNLHVGHWYAFALPDIYSRYLRMTGKNVLFPIGFDAFGLPAENAAIKRNLNPADWTEDNMKHMRKQITSMGASFDLSREVVTCDPEYYKWTQWLFIQLFNAGLVERKTTEANWCPSCKTVLANEQVVADKCERCDAEIEKKPMPQWQLKITNYADRLIDDLDNLDWPEEIKTSQKNWIGRSEGAEIEFALSNSNEKIKVFTTRPDTLFGATYMVLAPEHELVMKLKDKISNFAQVKEYVKLAQKKSDIERMSESKEKTGVKLEGITAINPANSEEIPVFIADYVLAHYGTGAIMAVPAHDQRDFEFAQKFGIEIKSVIDNNFDGDVATITEGKVLNSAQFDGLASEEAGRKITKFVGGKMTKTYKLRDWGVSRQRYWGCPIPLIHCAKCGWQAVSDEQLPVKLPKVENYLPREDGKSPLAKAEYFAHTTCPQCGGQAERETDTLDTFVDSSWYFLRYCDAQNSAQFASKEKLAKWMPVDQYSGGAEHTTMHLLYSRFFHKALFDLGLVAQNEPYTKRVNRGLILGTDGNKMSKSKGNVIDPDDIVQKLGADTMRMYLAFIGPYNEIGNYPWKSQAIIGVRRFFERVWKLQQKVVDLQVQKDKNNKNDAKIDKILHQTLRKVTDSITQMKLNTGVAALMECVNMLEKVENMSTQQLVLFVTMIYPYAPHIAEELREIIGTEESLIDTPWPTVNDTLLVESEIILVIQVNGKMRDKMTVLAGLDDAELEQKALASKKVQNYINGKKLSKVIVVQGKLVNIVM